jgi:hypothetical protein
MIEVADELVEGIEDEYGPVPPDTIRFHYLKAPFFRTIHVDGAVGSITARGYIHAAIYSERKSIPHITEQKYTDDTPVGKEVVVRARQHVVREMEVDLVFDYRSAIEFRDWLNRKLVDWDTAFRAQNGPKEE